MKLEVTMRRVERVKLRRWRNGAPTMRGKPLAMTEEAENEPTVTLDGTVYRITQTAFRSHFQVMGPDGKLLGLLELVDAPTGGLKFMARPASGTGMTQALMLRIADAATEQGAFG